MWGNILLKAFAKSAGVFLLLVCLQLVLSSWDRPQDPPLQRFKFIGSCTTGVYVYIIQYTVTNSGQYKQGYTLNGRSPTDQNIELSPPSAWAQQQLRSTYKNRPAYKIIVKKNGKECWSRTYTQADIDYLNIEFERRFPNNNDYECKISIGGNCCS